MPDENSTAKSNGEKWIRISTLFINDLRTFFPQTIDSKRARIRYFMLS